MGAELAAAGSGRKGRGGESRRSSRRIPETSRLMSQS